MSASLLLARLILAAVFGAAGITKFFDRKSSVKAIEDFGVPENLAKPLGFLLPIAEIATAVLLLAVDAAWIGAICALILLLSFIGIIAYNLARGNAPDCHCFGQIYSEPIGWPVLIRNLFLTAIAGFIVVFNDQNSSLSAFEWILALSIGERMQLVLGLAIIGLLISIVVFLQKMIAQQIVLQRQMEFFAIGGEDDNATKQIARETTAPPKSGLPIGAVVPNFATTDIHGRQASFDDFLLHGKPILVFFTSATCAPCAALLPTIEKWQAEVGEKLTIALLSTGTIQANKEKFGQTGAIVLNQKDREISALFRAQWTPSAVFINADGTVASDLVAGDSEIQKLLDKIKTVLLGAANGNGTKIHHNHYLFSPAKLTDGAPHAGQPAPDFALPTLDKRQNISLADLRGRRTFLLLWRATCPFCQKLLTDFKKWEAEQQDFNVLVVAADEPEVVLAKEFQSTVVVERDFELNKKLNNNSAPAALIIDENGRIASDIVRGAEDIFALAGYQPSKN